jgi:hypothetical protein
MQQPATTIDTLMLASESVGFSLRAEVRERFTESGSIAKLQNGFREYGNAIANL